jgi:hypothetical protein
MGANIGVSIGGSFKSPKPATVVVLGTMGTTGKDIELAPKTWPVQPITKVQIMLALNYLKDILIQTAARLLAAYRYADSMYPSISMRN